MVTLGVLLLTAWTMLRPETETNQKILSLRYPKGMFSSFCLIWDSSVISSQSNKFYCCINLKIIFRNTHRIKSFYPYKDKLNRSLKSKVVYTAGCWDCNDFLHRQNEVSTTWQKIGPQCVHVWLTGYTCNLDKT